MEYTWLRCIAELRSFGIPLEKIKKIKDFFFKAEINEFRDLFIKTLEGFTEVQVPEKENIILFFKKKDIPGEIWHSVLEKLQLSLFTLFILEILVYNSNICFSLDGEDNIQLVILGDTDKKRKQKSEEAATRVMNSSFILINLRKIVQGFFEKDSIKYGNDYIISFLSPGEKKIISAVQKKGIKEILVRFDEKNKPVRIELTSAKKAEEATHLVARVLKKGNYGTITIKQADGKLLQYKQKDIMKL